MRRRLLLLDLALIALLVLAASALRREWRAADARARRELGQAVKPVPPPPAQAVRQPVPVAAADYLEIAQKMLFSKDRNPEVVVEPPAPPPPKPMPPLPVFYGVMNLGDGPIAILSEKAGQPNRDFRPGQKVGEFTLVAVNTQEIQLDWEGKRITKKLDELVQAPEPAPAERRPGGTTVRPAAAAVRKAAPPVKNTNGPGVDVGGGMRACVAGDAAPAGAVVDGLRKVVSETPFGQVCRWEPVR